jgi:hypothetical protein
MVADGLITSAFIRKGKSAHMTTPCRLACAAALWLAATAPAALADTLLATFSYESVGTLGGAEAWKPFISYGNPGDAGAITMNGVTMTPIDIAAGDSFDLTGDLAGFNTLATNGTNDAMRIGIFVDGGTGHNATATESSLMSTATFYVPGIGTPDFAGYSVSRISILGTLYAVGETTPPDVVHFRTSTEFSFYTDDVVAAPVPLPAAAPMGLACLALFATYRRLRAFGLRVLGA